MFDEKKLREEIVKTWGAYGAHCEVFDLMIKRIKTLEQTTFMIIEDYPTSNGSYLQDKEWFNECVLLDSKQFGLSKYLVPTKYFYEL